MVLLNASYGKLLYLILGYPDVKDSYLVTFNHEYERCKILDRLERDAAKLRHGIDNKDPNLVESIANNITYINSRGQNWYPCPIDTV